MDGSNLNLKSDSQEHPNKSFKTIEDLKKFLEKRNRTLYSANVSWNISFFKMEENLYSLSFTNPEESLFIQEIRERLKETKILKHLDIKIIGKRATDKTLKSLKGVEKLSLLQCFNITDEELRDLKELKELTLNNCPEVTGSVFRCLKIEKLSLIDSKINNKQLCHLKELKELTLNNCPNITDEGLKHLGGVKELTLNNCPNITDEGLKHLGGVKELTLNNCPDIIGKGLNNLKTIKKLDLTKCSNITHELFKYLTDLVELAIDNCSKINISKLENISKIKTFQLISKCTKEEELLTFLLRNVEIQELLLTYIPITNKTLKSLEGKKLTKIEFDHCANITIDNIYYFIKTRNSKNLNSLEKLDIEYCKKIDYEKIGEKFRGDDKLQVQKKANISPEYLSNYTIVSVIGVSKNKWGQLFNEEDFAIPFVKKITQQKTKKIEKSIMF